MYRNHNSMDAKNDLLLVDSELENNNYKEYSWNSENGQDAIDGNEYSNSNSNIFYKQRNNNSNRSLIPSGDVKELQFIKTDDIYKNSITAQATSIPTESKFSDIVKSEIDNYFQLTHMNSNDENNHSKIKLNIDLIDDLIENHNINTLQSLSSKMTMDSNENLLLTTTTTTTTTSLISDTRMAENYSITNNSYLDILNDDNIINSLVLNDTFYGDLSGGGNITSDIVAIQSNSTATIMDIDSNLWNTTKFNQDLISNSSSNLSISNLTSSLGSSIEIDISYTPSMSQVIFAPTMTSFINFASIPTDSSYIAMGSIANGAGSGISGSGGVAFGLPESNTTAINSFYFYKTEQLTLLWILFTLIVLGNTAVLFTLFMNKNRKSRMNFFIKQLAIADLCVGLFIVLTDIVWRLTVTWQAGNTACKIIRFSECCITYASTYVLVALSIDRYDAITHPMNFSGSWRRARILVILAWVISAVFSIPILFLYKETVIEGQSQCWIDLKLPWRWQLYFGLISITLFFIPTLIISACYAIIIRTIWVKGSVFVPAERSGRNSTCLASRRASSRGIIPRAKVKTVKMTFVIVIVFVLCWSPYFFYNLWEVFGQPAKTQKSIAISTFIQSLAPLNSAANPLIYCLFSTHLCRTLKRVPPFRWFSFYTCCNNKRKNNSTQHRCATLNQRLHNSCDSMRTLTTSLNVSRRSNNCMRPARVVIVERPKTIIAMSEV